VPAVARAAPVLADPHLLAQLVPEDANRHGAVLRREIGIAVAAEHQDARLERLALVESETLHEQPLALPDAVLLPSD
jgi:hypothetical protein